jgi:predicted HicB family RNase H-like nuclease
MKGSKSPKTVKVSDDVHAEMKVHVAKKQVGVTEFVDKAIRNQIKKESSR